MREILFRGQTRRKGEKVRMDGSPVDSNWVYGGIFPGEGDRSIIYQTKPEINKFPVYSDTVGQYTGLTDKNSVRIFEGDILKFYGEDGDEESYTKYEVIWLENGWHAQDVHRLYMADTLSPPSWVKEHFEVIGNIYDNPELLRKESKYDNRESD